jgi:NADH-quinone oxidoreductase subunit E
MEAEIRALLPRYPSKQAVTLPALHIVQDELRCVPDGAVEEIAEILELSPAQVHDTLSFYGFFRSTDDPLGKHRVWICRSISCALRGGDELFAELCDRLHVAPGGKTADGKVTLEFAECLGACEQAPCLLVDDELKGNVTVESAAQICSDLARD